MNILCLKGKVCNDPQLFNTDKYHLTKIVLAVPRPFTNKTTDFIGIDFFGKTADVVAQYVCKGADLVVEGHVQTSKNKSTYNKSIIGDKVYFLGDKYINTNVEDEFAYGENANDQFVFDYNENEFTDVSSEDLPF